MYFFIFILFFIETALCKQCRPASDQGLHCLPRSQKYDETLDPLATHWVHTEDWPDWADGHFVGFVMLRLAARTCHFVGFVMRRLIWVKGSGTQDNIWNIESYLKNKILFEPRHEKTCLRGLRPGKTQTGLLNYRDKLESWIFEYRN